MRQGGLWKTPASFTREPVPATVKAAATFLLFFWAAGTGIEIVLSFAEAGIGRAPQAVAGVCVESRLTGSRAMCSTGWLPMCISPARNCRAWPAYSFIHLGSPDAIFACVCCAGAWQDGVAEAWGRVAFCDFLLFGHLLAQVGLCGGACDRFWWSGILPVVYG